MKVDLRGFQYPLEPVRTQRHWQLDTLQGELGRLEGELRRAKDVVEELVRAYDEQRERVARTLAKRADPGAHRAHLLWLAAQRRSVATAEERVAELRRQRAELVARCLEQRQKVEVVERHRDECQADFIRDAEARQWSEADREWLARRHWSHTSGAALLGRRGR